MHKIYLRDFYPPVDVIIYGLSLSTFSFLAIFYLSKGGTYSTIPYFLVAAASLMKLLSAFRVTTLFTTFISAGNKGILVRSYFTPSKSYNWQSIEKLEVRHDRLVVVQQNEKKNRVYYFSSLSDNDAQLTNLLKTIAPVEHRNKIG